ncbi:hypothetical protein QR680_018815 [Steinernema hermaphroditum]|uniref:Uncharacterized protein n=1 Tax=Steinernema hermaphroditum TaxID=289476 RepID=A0AA39HK13_9BILA|nr:hypothetical protein QR680_018815 [Steinernema hermaphroditum]
MLKFVSFTAPPRAHTGAFFKSLSAVLVRPVLKYPPQLLEGSMIPSRVGLLSLSLICSPFREECEQVYRIDVSGLFMPIANIYPASYLDKHSECTECKPRIGRSPFVLPRPNQMIPLIEAVQIVLYCLLALFVVGALYVISGHERQRRLADKDIPELEVSNETSLRSTILRSIPSVLKRAPRRDIFTDRTLVDAH